VNSTLLDCIDENRALYAIQLIGAMADNTLQLWSNHEIHNLQGINVGVGIVSLCNDSCLTKDQETFSNTGRAMIVHFHFAVINTLLICLIVPMVLRYLKEYKTGRLQAVLPASMKIIPSHKSYVEVCN